MGERKPLRRREYEALLHVTGAVDVLKGAAATLAPRASRLPETAERLGEDLAEVLRTIPTDKLIRIRKDLDHTTIYTKTEAPGIKTIDPEVWRYVPAWALNQAVDAIADAHCYLCEESAEAGRRCRVREMMEALLPHEIEWKAQDGCCPWSGLKLGLTEIVREEE